MWTACSNATRNNNNGRWGIGSAYIYRGCIINPAIKEEKPVQNAERKIGDIVTVDGIFTSSTSTKKLKPAKNTGKITTIIVGARNPYLLDNGNIGWTNDSCIVGTLKPSTIKNTVGEYKILKQTCHLYSKPNLTGIEYTYLKDTKVKILKNISSTVDYIKVVKTGREAYINNKYFK